MALSSRLQNLFECCVEQYIQSAVPISSTSVCGRLQTKFSSATVRNDLKILEEIGFLKQVHTSGGRVPTTAGYRHYVNTVLNSLNIKAGELSFAAEQISGRTRELPTILDEICNKLGDKFNYPIIVKQQFDKLIVTDIKIVPLVDGATMVLVKTSVGSINQTIQTDTPFTDRQCEDAASALLTRCSGCTLKQMVEDLPKIAGELKKSLVFFEELVKKLSEKLERFIDRNNHMRHNVIRLLDIPDYASVEKIKQVDRALDDAETFDKLFESKENVVIGAEVARETLDGSSVIKFDYKIGGESIATVGILGPERMDYKNLIAALYSLLATTRENRKIATSGVSPPKVEFMKFPLEKVPKKGNEARKNKVKKGEKN